MFMQHALILMKFPGCSISKLCIFCFEWTQLLSLKTPSGVWSIGYLVLLKTGLGILDFYHSDWLNGARLSAHIPAVTKYGQWTLNNKMNKVSWRFFPRQQPGEKNRQEKSLGSEFELSRNSNSVINSFVWATEMCGGLASIFFEELYQ